MELLPCPFCGSNKLYITDSGSPIFVICKNCQCEVEKNIWNTRHYPWISVKDSLPENNQFCLVYYNPLNIDDNDMGIGINRYSTINAWLLKETYAYECGITHWMPLPSPPEEK